MKEKNENVTFETLTFQEIKKGRTEHITQDTLVSTRPLYILDWEITAKANGTGVLKFYDGPSAGSALLMEIQVTKSSTLCQNYTWPRYFSQGLYLGFGGDVYHICLHYILEPVM